MNCGLDEISTPVLEILMKTRHSWCLIVERNDSIERLNVSHNHIRRSGGVAIFKALQVSVTLCNQCCVVLLGDFNYRTNNYRIHSQKSNSDINHYTSIFTCYYKHTLIYVSLRLRVQNRRKKWNFPLNFRTMCKLSDLYSGIFQNY